MPLANHTLKCRWPILSGRNHKIFHAAKIQNPALKLAVSGQLWETIRPLLAIGLWLLAKYESRKKNW